MNLDSIIKKILYVPYNEEYLPDDNNIRKLLTEEEFFERCFYMPDFEKEIKELLEKSEEEIQAFEVDLTKEELIQKHRRNKNQKEAFFNWISNNQNEIYCIRGDAGTGKTTFVHYLQYMYKNTNIEWDIIDMNMSIKEVKILRNMLYIPRYYNVYFKSISILIKKIVDNLFVSIKEKGNREGRISIESSYRSIKKMVSLYSQMFNGTYPTKFVDDFFCGIRELLESESSEQAIVECCADFIFNYFDSYLIDSKRKRDKVLSDFIKLYIYYNCCTKSGKRTILVFDNLERFIGTEEIYDKQLIDFISEIRQTQQAISYNNNYIASCFQIAIFMRNTSTRMFTPQQISEIFPHIVDLSEWFQSAKILQKKIDWYRAKNICIEQSDILLDIINDIGPGKDGNFRGLRSKLNMLFNNDKRVIVNMLTKVLENETNKHYLEIYNFFRINPNKIDCSLTRFAKRIIIFRLILNELRRDGFFSNIATEREMTKKASLGYARKILTILHEHKWEYEDGYMKFDDIITKLDTRESGAIERYFARHNQERRKIISKVLFYMNYYDGRTENWLQFIDIQYNFSQLKTSVGQHNELKRLIDEKHEFINIKITSAGMAYLFFVVYSFEYFSCKSIKNAPQDCVGIDGSIPPVLCALPSTEEILEEKVENLLCVKIFDFVSKEAINCIKKMREDKENGEKTIPFKKGLTDRYLEHGNRIINSHVGFIDNYMQCIRELYKSKLRHDQKFWEKYQIIENKLELIKGDYLKCK